MLAKFNCLIIPPFPKVLSAGIRQDVRLPRQFKETLLSMVEMHINEALSLKEFKFNCLSDVFLICGVLANLLFGLAKIRFVLFTV